MPDEDKNFGGALVLDFRKRWRHVKTIHYFSTLNLTARQLCEKQARGWPITTENLVIAAVKWWPYLGIKQSVGVLDVVTLTVYSIVWSWWNVHVYIWHAKLEKSSQKTS